MTTRRKILETQGQTLLLALLIMAGVTAAGVGISTVIINQIRQSKNISESTQASYTAESVLEKSLYIIKEERKKSTAVLQEEGKADLIDELSSIYLPDLNYDILEATSTVQDTEVAVKENDTYQIDLFDPDQKIGLEDIEYILIAWDNNPCSVLDDQYGACFGTGGEWAEVTWISWDYYSQDLEERKEMIPAANLAFKNISDEYCPKEPDFDNSPSREDFEKKPCYLINVKPTQHPNYRVRVRSLYGDIESLIIKAFDDGNNPISVGVESWVVVKALGIAGGETGSIRQALQIEAPWKVPLTGILNFTILSEEEIDK